MVLPSLVDINTVENGKPIKEEILDANNNLKQLKEYFYLNKKSNIHYGNKISFFRKIISTCGAIGSYQCPDGFYAYNQHLVGYYAIFDKQSILYQERTTDYYTSGNIITKKITEYNSSNLPLEISITDGNNKEIAKEIYTYSPNSVHVNKNLLSLQSQKSIYKNSSILSNTIYSYSETNGITLPASVTLQPLGNPNPLYLKKVFYDQYDDAGNLLQFHSENDISTYIIWGYNKTLPIAKIENATYTQINGYLTNLQNLSNTGSELNLISAFASLRAAIPTAMITSYTHIPGVGISSITDARGISSYFKYDDYGRLMALKDNENKMLLEYEYHFRPQN